MPQKLLNKMYTTKLKKNIFFKPFATDFVDTKA